MEHLNNTKQASLELIELLQATELFADVHQEVAEELLKRLHHIKLAKGDILFEEGSTSDLFYILLDGHLTAYLKAHEGIKERTIGTIGKGETVGELGALSNRPRSLSIRATTDSELLQLNREEFETLSKDHPQMLLNLIHYIINRSQNTLKLISEKKVHKHVAIIQGNLSTPVTHFFRILKENIQPFQKVCILDPEKSSINLSKEIIEAEKLEETLIFYVTPGNIESLKLKLTHIGSLYVLVYGDREPEFSEFALEMMKGRYSPFITDLKLVLLHDDKIELPKGTIDWLQKINFTMHHHLRFNDRLGYQQLLRHMIGKPIAVVLGGGGGKGWASLGALKAFIDHKIPIDAIGGTSVGAFIGACYAAHMQYEQIVKNFNKLSFKPFAWYNFTWPIISLLSATSGTAILQKMFGNLQIENLWIPFFSIATNLSTGKEVVHRSGTLWERLRASMAIPGILPPVVIDGDLYVDGGLMNNLPVDTMRSLIGYESKIIALSLAGYGEDKVRYNFPPSLPFRIGFMKKLRLGYKDYNFPPFFNTFMSSLMAGASAREKANRLLADVSISPDLHDFGSLKVDLNQNNKLIQIGYLSTRESLKIELAEYFDRKYNNEVD